MTEKRNLYGTLIDEYKTKNPQYFDNISQRIQEEEVKIVEHEEETKSPMKNPQPSSETIISKPEEPQPTTTKPEEHQPTVQFDILQLINIVKKITKVKGPQHKLYTYLYKCFSKKQVETAERRGGFSLSNIFTIVEGINLDDSDKDIFFMERL